MVFSHFSKEHVLNLRELGKWKGNKQKEKMAEGIPSQKTKKKKEKKKLMVGLQIIHGGPFIPGNTTHNWTNFQQRGNGPSRTINYSSCLISFQKGYKTKGFL